MNYYQESVFGLRYFFQWSGGLLSLFCLLSPKMKCSIFFNVSNNVILASIRCNEINSNSTLYHKIRYGELILNQFLRSNNFNWIYSAIYNIKTSKTFHGYLLLSARSINIFSESIHLITITLFSLLKYHFRYINHTYNYFLYLLGWHS